jgi:hypothetical protein
MQAPYQSLKQRYLGFNKQPQKTVQLFAQSKPGIPYQERLLAMHEPRRTRRTTKIIPVQGGFPSWSLVSFVVCALVRSAGDEGCPRSQKAPKPGVKRARRDTDLGSDFRNGLWHVWAIL